MAGSELIIDDVFVPEMATYFKETGHRLEIMYKNYIDEMKTVRSEAVMSGDVASAMDVFIEYAGMITDTIEGVSLEISNDTSNFMIEIDLDGILDDSAVAVINGRMPDDAVSRVGEEVIDSIIEKVFDWTEKVLHIASPMDFLDFIEDMGKA